MISVFNILLTLLILLSCVSVGLFIAYKRNPYSELLNKIITILKGWWMIYAVVSIASLIGKWGIWFLFLSISIYGIFEYLNISRFCTENKKRISIFYSIGTLIFYVLILSSNSALPYMFAMVFQLLISTVLLLQNKNVDSISLTIAIGFGVFTLIAALGSIAQVAFLGEKIWHATGAGVAALLILIILTSLNDVFQFIGGKLFGRRKVVPHLSPNKTEAGFIIGILATSLLGSILFHTIIGMSWTEGIALGLATGLSGMLGDLFLSAVKRSNKVKDFSDLIPGHGGILDRIDSLIFTAPVFLFTLMIVSKGVL